jgi:hypothetical protein
LDEKRIYTEAHEARCGEKRTHREANKARCDEKWIHTEANKSHFDKKNGYIHKQTGLVVIKKMDTYISK